MNAATSALVAIVVLASGCVTWSDPRIVTRQRVTPGEITLRDDALPGSGRLQADGDLRFTLDASRLCVRTDVVHQQLVATQRKQLRISGMVGLAAGASMVASGSYDRLSSGDGGTFFMVVGSAIVGTVLALRFLPGTRLETAQVATSRPSAEPEQVACDGAAAPLVGALTARPPWGAAIVAVPDDEGVAVFPVDWARSPTVPDAVDAGAQLAVPWTITSKAGIAGRFVPSPDDVRLAMAAVRQARGEAIITTAPASLVMLDFAADGLLEVGSRGVLRLTMANHGQGTALGVTVRTRSSVAALHDLVFDFERLQPGADKTVHREVTMPPVLDEPSVTVVLVFSEDRGGAPAEHTARLDVAQSLCPEGKLSRAAYQKKLDRLRRTRDAGAITDADLAGFEARLVRCIE